MTKMRALNIFFNSFGVPAYPTNSVDHDNATPPYITYEPIFSNWYGEQTTHPYLNVWMKTTSEAEINALCDKISKEIGSGVRVKCDDGLLFVTFSSSWQAGETGDIALRRKFTTLNIDFFTF